MERSGLRVQGRQGVKSNSCSAPLQKSEFFVGKRRVFEGGDIFIQLRGGGSAHDNSCDASGLFRARTGWGEAVTEDPCKRGLCGSLSTICRDFYELFHFFTDKPVFSIRCSEVTPVRRHAGVLRNAAQILSGKQPLRKRAECHKSQPCLFCIGN